MVESVSQLVSQSITQSVGERAILIFKAKSAIRVTQGDKTAKSSKHEEKSDSLFVSNVTAR